MDPLQPPAPEQGISPTPPETGNSAAAAREDTFTLQIRLPRLERWVGPLVLALAILLNLVMFRHEVSVDAPPLNDNVVHLVNLRHAAEAIRLGQDPSDPWIPEIDLGYPLFHHYQHLSYQLPALAVVLSGGALSPETVLRWTLYLLFCLLPLPLYWSGRRLGLDRVASLLAAVLGPLLATYGLYGLDAYSYSWSGFGLYTQVWAAWLFPMALAQAYHTLRTGKGYFLAVALISALLLSHLVYAYMLFASLALLVVLAAWRPKADEAVVPGDTWSRRALRLLAILGLVALATSYFALPYLLDHAYMNRSIWELPWKYDSFGASWVLGHLVRGEMFDAGRFPSLTLLLILGAGYCLWQWRVERHRLAVFLFLFWLFLYFGRPTWGFLLNILPLGEELHLHRLVAGVHLAGIYLMGLGLAWPWRWALSRAKRRYLLAPALLTLLLLIPVYRERVASYAQNATWMQETADAVAAEQTDLDALVDAIQEHGPGRVYAGLPATWGGEVKIGAVPLYAYLNGRGLDMVGFLYHALSLNADIQVLFDDALLEQYQLFNVRYVVTPRDWLVPDFYHALGDYGRFRLYEIPSGGYFDLVDSDMAFVGANTDLYPAASAWLYSSLLSAKQHPSIALGAAPLGYPKLYPLEEAAAEIPLMQPSPGADRGQILSQAVGSNWFQADALIQRDCWLMLKVTYHPGWRAYVDGAPAETVMLMPSYVGVRLGPGQHTVRLAYSGGAARLALMGLGALTLALLALAERRPNLAARLRERLFARWGREPQPPAEAGAQEGGEADAALAAGEPAAQVQDGAPTPPWPNRRFLLGLYLALLAIYLMSGAGHFFSTDHVAVYLVTESLLERGELALPGPMNDSLQGPDGKHYSMFGVGQSLVAMPLYILGKTVDGIATPEIKRLFGGVDLGQWGGTVPIYFVSLLNQFLSPLLCLLVLKFCLRLGYSRRTSLVTTLVFGLGTATWAYARDSFQHPLESLTLLAALYTLYAHRESLRPKHLLFAGSALGLGVLTRSNLLLAAPLLAVYLFHLLATQAPRAQRSSNDQAPRSWLFVGATEVRDWWRRGVERGAVRSILLLALPVTLSFALTLEINHIRHGSYLAFHPLAQAAGFSTPAWVGLYGNLLSPGRGLFLYSPPLILALFAASEFYRSHRAEALLFGALSLLYLLLYSLYSYWDGGWAWGPRSLLPCLPYLAIPLAGYVRSRKRAVALALLTVLGIMVQISGVTINYGYVYHEWLAQGLNPSKAFLFVPEISPIPTHWQALLSGRNIDLWLYEVWKGFGPRVFALTLLVFLGILGSGLTLLDAPRAALAWLRPRLAGLRKAPSPEA